VSVGLPVYNGEPYLAATLDSLLAQTLGDFELIVSDNASTDRTEDIGRAYAEKDARVRYSRNDRNLGLAGNCNRTLELARGRYFRLAAADDLSAPELLAECVAILEDDPSVVLAYPKTTLIDAEGRVIAEYDDNLNLDSPDPRQRFVDLLERLGLCNAIFGVIRADVLKSIAPMGCHVGADVHLLAELSLHGKFVEVPKFLFFRRMHEKASSAMTADQLQVFYDPERSPTLAFRRWRNLWEFCRMAGRAPLGITQKGRLILRLLRVGPQGRRALGQELVAGTRHALRQLVPRAR
jgi:glycosyltransferase involved in cell wall biosynthesis